MQKGCLGVIELGGLDVLELINHAAITVFPNHSISLREQQYIKELSDGS